MIGSFIPSYWSLESEAGLRMKVCGGRVEHRPGKAPWKAELDLECLWREVSHRCTTEATRDYPWASLRRFLFLILFSPSDFPM